MSKTLFLSPPSFDGFDGGAGARYQAKREIRSFWFPTWLAQPAALVPNSRVLDAPADEFGVAESLQIARDYDLVIMHTSTPSFPTDAKFAQLLKQDNPRVRIGLVGAKVMVEPAGSLLAAPAGIEAGMRLSLEPINHRDMPGFHLNTMAQAAAVIAAMGTALC